MNQELLKELLDYNPETGKFYWKVSKMWQISVGDEAGTLHKKECIHIKINQKSYRAHRLAWLYMYGTWPKNMIDHINGDATDNRITNLRDVTNGENQRNRKSHRNGRLPGTTWHKYKKLWMATAFINNKSKFIGYYDTEIEAYNASQEALTKFS